MARLLYFLFFALFALTLNNAASSDQKPIVKIGIICPLSGSIAFCGEEYVNSARLAIEQLPANSKVKFELIAEDNQGQAAKTAMAANKLIFQNKVDVILSLYSYCGNVVAPLTEKNKVIHFGVAFDNSVAKGLYNFTLCTQPPPMIRLLVQKLKEKHISRLAMAYINNQGSVVQATELIRQAREAGIEICFQEKFNFGDKDFRMIISKLAVAKPHALFLMAFPPEQEIFMQQFREAKVNVPVTGIATFEMSRQLELFEGCWYVSTSEPTNELKSLFKKKYGSVFVADNLNSYDMVNILAVAYDRALSKLATYRKIGISTIEKPSTEAIAREILSIKQYYGATGKLTIDSEGVFDSEPAFKIIKNAQPAVSKE